MKRTRVKFAAASLALVGVVLLAVSALAAAGPSLATAVATAAPAGGSGGAFLTINPLAGFPLDPFLVSAQGGGPVDASTLA